jgi:hypothetical protein
VIGPKVLVVRWLLPCALAFGVVGMHHLASMCQENSEQAEVTFSAAPSDERATVQTVTPDDCCGDHDAPAGTHDLLHLCLAVLAAGLVLGALLVHWCRAVRNTGPPPRLGAPRRQRPPRRPPGATPILASVGVLRL